MVLASCGAKKGEWQGLDKENINMNYTEKNFLKRVECEEGVVLDELKEKQIVCEYREVKHYLQCKYPYLDINNDIRIKSAKITGNDKDDVFMIQLGKGPDMETFHVYVSGMPEDGYDITDDATFRQA